MTTHDAILTAIHEQQVKFINLWFTDITGMVKSIVVPSGDAEDVLHNGCAFDGSSIEGFARAAESDMVLMPDLRTFTILPWDASDERTARLICTVYTPQGEPF